MKQRVMKFLGKIFNQKEIPESTPVKKVHKHIQEMKNLQAELFAIETGFNKAIAEKVQEHDSANYHYELAYMDFAELHRKHRLGLVNESVITDERAKLKPLEDAVSEVGGELDTIQRYKKEEILSVLNQMNDFQDDYLSAKAEEMNVVASKLAYMKKQYQTEFTTYVTGCREVFEMEQDIMYQLQQYGFNNKPVMGDKFTLLMVGKPPVPFK